MKKFIAYITLVCYFAATCGVIMNFHFCMNRLASVHLFETSAEKCARCGMETHKSFGCCHDEVKMVKMHEDQNKIPVILFELAAIKDQVSIPSEFISAAFFTIKEQRHFHNHSPPLLSEQDTYLKNNVFRI